MRLALVATAILVLTDCETSAERDAGQADSGGTRQLTHFGDAGASMGPASLALAGSTLFFVEAETTVQQLWAYVP